VAVAADLLLAAVSVAVSGPTLVGANTTVTVQDLPGPRLVALQVSVVVLNGADNGDKLMALLADPPVFLRVNPCEGVWPMVTEPKEPGEGEKANAGSLPGTAPAALAPAIAATDVTLEPRATAAPITTRR
jgi:hypothetical protein